ncbi:hypothetical protein BpHYR1_041556, partial [Brachionus plicatilis]
MNLEVADSYRIISKLLELFTNIGPTVYDKLIRLMQTNGLIGLKNDKLSLEDLFTNRVNLVKSSFKIVYLFKSEDYNLIINYFKLIECLIKESGRNLEFISPICAVLVYVFPQINKWNNTHINLNINLSIVCLNLLHAVLNTSSEASLTHSDFKRNFASLHSESSVNLDQFCEIVLLNTECSESLLNLIYTVYECSQDINFMSYIEKLDEILIQSISLINRLIVIPEGAKDEQEQKKNTINQSLLYFLLIRAICQQSQSGTSNFSLLNKEDAQSNEVISKNNQFLLQLNLLMSQSNPYLNKNLINSTITDNKNDTNWFHLLTKIFIYKSNQILDCLLFSIFKKISQLTPRLFGSLIGPHTNQMHVNIIEKLKSQESGIMT